MKKFILLFMTLFNLQYAYAASGIAIATFIVSSQDTITDTLASCGDTTWVLATPDAGYKLDSAHIVSGSGHVAKRGSDTIISVPDEGQTLVTEVYFSGIIAPTITVQPQRDSVVNNATASFTITATGDPTLVYKWQRKPNASTWGNVGTDQNSYSFTASTTNNRDSVRCIVSNEGGADTSNTVALIVLQLPTFTYATNPATYTQNSAITPNTITGTGGAIDSFTGTVATGLSLNHSTGAVSGTPTVLKDSAYQITAHNASGTSNTSLQISIVTYLDTLGQMLANPAIDTIRLDSIVVASGYAVNKPIICRKMHITTTDSATFSNSVTVRDTLLYDANSKIGTTANAKLFGYVYPPYALTIIQGTRLYYLKPKATTYRQMIIRR